MNESFLQENPLQIFDDFVQIPNEAFNDERDLIEISALMDTIMENDDFGRVIRSLYQSSPEVVLTSKKTLSSYLKQAEKGDFGDGKKKEYVNAFMTRALADIDEIIECGGLFPKVKIRVTKIHPDAILPKYQTQGDAGADIYAVQNYELQPGETKIIQTGLKVAIPGGYEIQIRPRSGLSAKTGLRVCNAPGTIDSTYRGEVGVILQNTGSEPEKILKGSRIAQMVLKRQPKIVWDEISNEDFDKLATDRGAGFGSSGQ